MAEQYDEFKARDRGGASHLCQFVGFRVYSWIRAIPAGLVLVKRRSTCVLGATGVRPVFFIYPLPATSSFGFVISCIGNATCSKFLQPQPSARSPTFICKYRLVESEYTKKYQRYPPVVFTPNILTIRISCVPEWQSHFEGYIVIAMSVSMSMTLENTSSSAAQF